MLKLLSRNLFKISYALLPRSKTIAKQNISKSNLQYVLQHLSVAPKDRKNISEANSSSSSAPPKQQIRQHIMEIYSILSNEKRLALQRSMINNDPNHQFERDVELQNTIQNLSKCIFRHHKTLSLKSVKHCLVILKKVHEHGLEDLKINSTLSLLEQQFCFLHENPFIFKKRFLESTTILNSFTALNYRLSNKEYLSKWYKYSIENLKNFSSKEICKILYVSVFQMPENKEIYNTVKLQLFRPTPYYLQEVLKTRLYVNPKDYNKVTELLKVTFNRIFLSSYERKGLYWEKDFVFTLSDIVTVLQSYSLRGERNESYLSLLIQILKQTLQESIKTEADAIKNRKQFLKLLPVIANLSESEARYREQDYNHIVEVLVSVVINTIPNADVKQLAVISKNFNALWDKAQEKQGLKVCMAQLLEALTDNFESVNTDDVLIRYSGEYNEILINLAPTFMQNLKDDQVKVLSEKFKALTLSYLERVAKVIQGSIFYDRNNLYRTNQLIQKLEESREVSENVINKLRKSISDISFKGKEATESLVWNYLICFSLQTPVDGQISKTAQDNADYFTNYLIENLEIKSLTEQVLIQFFEIYANLFQSKLLSQIHIASQQNLDKIRRAFMRYIADHHQGLSIKGLEEIIGQCMRADLLESDFDDGSGLYSQNLLQEMNNHITKHLKEFSSEFQEKIKPYLEKYAEETAFETLTQTLKNISI